MSNNYHSYKLQFDDFDVIITTSLSRFPKEGWFYGIFIEQDTDRIKLDFETGFFTQEEAFDHAKVRFKNMFSQEKLNRPFEEYTEE
jgi:hypothetical protein